MSAVRKPPARRGDGGAAEGPGEDGRAGPGGSLTGAYAPVAGSKKIGLVRSSGSRCAVDGAVFVSMPVINPPIL